MSLIVTTSLYLLKMIIFLQNLKFENTDLSIEMWMGEAQDNFVIEELKILNAVMNKYSLMLNTQCMN